MINFRKPAFGALLGFTVIVASACGGSSATPAPASGGSSAAPVANGSDASSLLTQALSGSSSVKSFHVKLTVGGTIKAAALAAADSSGAAATDLKLDGTTLEGDVDLAKSAAHLSFALPALPQLGGIALTADLIMADQALYLKSALLGGAKYMKMDLGSLSSLTDALPLPSDLPVAVPSAGAGLSDMTKQVAELQKQLKDAGAKAEIVGTDKIGGVDATHVKVTVPVEWVNKQLAGAEASAAPAGLSGAKLDSAGVDLWVYKDNNQLAQFHVTGASSAIGNLDLMLTLTNYDKPVSISAPAASDVTDSSGLFPNP